MSIRIKLLISYSLMIAVPLILLYAFMHILFHVFVGEAKDIEKHFNPENSSLEQFLQDDVIVFAKLQMDLMSNPDRLLQEKIISGYDAELSDRRTRLLLVRDGRMVYQSPLIDSDTAQQILRYESESSLRCIDKERSLYMNGQWMICLGFPISFSDGKQGELYVVIDTDPISKFVHSVLPVLIIVFVMTFIAVSVAITYGMSRYLLEPIRKLKEAAVQVKEGNLDYSPGIMRKDELGELGAAFDEMRLRLKTSIDTQLKYEDNRKQLITNISHDLRTPITAIKGYVNGIKDGVANNPEKLLEYVNTISEKTTELDRMIDELFLYSKLDVDRVPFVFAEIDLCDYLHEYVNNASEELAQLGIRLDFDCQLSEGLKVTVDEDKLKRVIANIVSNSAKYMHATNKTITIRAALDAEQSQLVKISIEDNGAGIKKQHLPYVFDRFYRADSSRNQQFGGSGLGLAIARQIVEAHGGTITIESDEGKGTVVHFTLTIAE